MNLGILVSAWWSNKHLTLEWTGPSQTAILENCFLNWVLCPHRFTSLWQNGFPTALWVKIVKIRYPRPLHLRLESLFHTFYHQFSLVAACLSLLLNKVTTSVRGRVGDDITQSQDDDGNVRNCSILHMFIFLENNLVQIPWKRWPQKWKI